MEKFTNADELATKNDLKLFCEAIQAKQNEVIQVLSQTIPLFGAITQSMELFSGKINELTTREEVLPLLDFCQRSLDLLNTTSKAIQELQVEISGKI